MTTTTAVDAATLRATIGHFADALQAHKPSINSLNVYPVPDGDTGTNMALTIESVVAELSGAGDSMADVCGAISHGSLMGARGNSGVILSQILRGLSAGFADREVIDAATFSAALTAAAVAAYGAVMRPVEGTILTVTRESAEAAASAVDAGVTELTELMECTRKAGGESLARTPELLQVLADAGVVDAGGAGLLLLFDAFLTTLDGRPLPEPSVVAHLDLAALDTPGHEPGIADLRYEVMYFLEAPDTDIDGFKRAWMDLGDSIVVVGGEGMWNCHVHTGDIGGAIEAGIAVGRPRDIRVTDLLEEVEERSWVEEHLEPRADLPPVTTAVVAVAAGDGVAAIFRSLGVYRVVQGGQSMNPSTADLLAAVEEMPADEVVLLPNNKNIIPVAAQVNAQSEKSVLVVPTRGIPEGFASLLSYDPHSTGEANAAAMAAAAEAVLTGEVTVAVRDSNSDVGPISEGDVLGIAAGKIATVAASLTAATIGLLDQMVDDEHEIVTLIVGAGATEPDTATITKWLAEHRPEVEVEVHDGGQPLYPYYVGVE